MRTAKTWWWAAAAVAVAALLWLVLGRARAIDVDLGAVTEGPLRVTINEAGTTRVRGHADVNAPVAGRWVPAARRAGDPVQAGTPLGTLSPAPMDAAAQEQARARVGAADAGVRAAEAIVTALRTSVEEARRTLERAERVGAAGGVAPQEVERARDAVVARRSELDGAVMRASAAAFELRGARAIVAPFDGTQGALRIVAPVGGTLLRLFEEHERVVAPGTPLAEVGDVHDLEVLIPMLTDDAARVRVGAAVTMTFGDRGDSVIGLVTRVEPTAFTKTSALGVEEQRVHVVASAPATDARVGAQYRVQAKVTAWASPRTLRVPMAALVRDGERWFAFVVESGRARRREVAIGERTEELAEVRGGLPSGAQVVRYPDDRLSDGTKVKARAQP
jgi:HlyD family secretion protein